MAEPAAPLTVHHARGATVLPVDGEHTVGRRSDCTVVVDDERVSRQHLRVVVRDHQWVLADLQSANGTFIDGRRVTEAVVTDGLCVHLGRAEGEASLRFDTTATPPIDAGAATVLAPNAPDRVPTRSGRHRREPVSPAELGPARLHRLDAHSIAIGRSDENEVVLNDLETSRRHAVLLRTGDGFRLKDLGSHNGTFLNGQRVTEAAVVTGDVIAIGTRSLHVTAHGLAEYAADETFPLAAVAVEVTTSDGTTLVEDVSFALEESSMLAILGPSGAGKSTLLAALAGLRPITGGRVLVGPHDLHAHPGALSRRIGYVPQDDLVQLQLTVRQSLTYAARLRFPPDVSEQEMDERVEEVMVDLGLAHRADTVVEALSGGQRKRVSIALELLTRPSVLFLDEPTSGLDPGYERSVMSVLRHLADTGRTVVLVTHSVESLHLCDRVLCLAPGGLVAWYGPPEATPGYFGRETYQEIFQLLDAQGAADHVDEDGATVSRPPEQWAADYRSHEASERYVDRPLAAHAATVEPGLDVAAGAPRSSGGWWRQFRTLTQRYARVVASDRRTLLILGITAPLVGLVLLARLPVDQLAAPASGAIAFSQAPMVLFLLAVATTQIATSTAVREIVKEREILRRERAVGLSLSAYLASKVAVLGVLTTVQAAVVALLATGRQGGPGPGVVLGSGRLELVVLAALVAIGAMAVGLLVSAVVSSPDRVALVLPAVVGFHLVALAGTVVPNAPRVPVLDEARYLSSTYWGYAAMAGTADVEQLATANRIYQAAPDLTLDELVPALEHRDMELVAAEPGHLARDPRTWWRNVAAAGGLSAVALMATLVALRRTTAG